MKKTILILAAVSTLMMQSCFTRIGKLTMISTRNVDSKTDYVLVKKDVSAKAKTKKKDAFEIAVDKCVKSCATGEFMKNVVIEISKSGRKIKVTGDVWGYPETATTK